MFRLQNHAIGMTKRIPAPIAFAKTRLCGQILFPGWMKLAATNKAEIYPVSCTSIFLCMIEAFTIAGGKALIKIKVSGVGSQGTLAQRLRDQAQGIDGAEDTSGISISVPSP